MQPTSPNFKQNAREAIADDPLQAALAKLAATLDPGLFEEAELRTAEAGSAASQVAAIPEVRAALLQLQRDFTHPATGAVLDGRDIGTVVCPDADVKLWIDADRHVGDAGFLKK